MSTYPVQQPAPPPKKSNKTWIIVLIVALVLCCLCTILVIGGYFGYQYLQNNNTAIGEQFGITPPSADNNPQATGQPGVTPQQPLFQLPDPFGVKLGDEVRCGQCGFSFNKVPNYDFNNDWGTIMSMTAPGGDTYTGPVIMVVGGAPNQEMTNNEDLIKKLATEKAGITYSPPKNITVGGVSALSVDMEGTSEGVAVKGRTVVALVSSKQIFAIVGIAPAVKWEETRPFYEAVMNSVSFFTPEPTPVPTSTVKP